jgi:deazaflavin-dependent oxidoreductase (nitroreductase family)
MPLPRAIARFNKRVTNRIQLRWAHMLPGYAILEHTGRRSGRAFRTPLNVFRVPGGFVVPIAYGTQSDWLRNVLAAGGGQFVHRRVRYLLTDPQVLADGAGRDLLPAPVRLFSRLAHIDHVLQVTAVRV